MDGQEAVQEVYVPKDVATIFTDKGVTIYVDGEHSVINEDHPNYHRILEKLERKEYEGLIDLFEIPRAIERAISPLIQDGDLDNEFKVQGGLVFLNDEPFSEAVSMKLLRMVSKGLPVEPMKNFLKKVRENPSNSAQQELLLFCEANGFAIHEDGDIIAYKGVNSDFTDKFTGTIDNSVGKVVVMPRYKVDDRRDVTCSHGLHFASHNYAKHSYGGANIVVVKIHPRDVVSIPSDYNDQKGRCCQYEVISTLPPQHQQLKNREVYNDASVRAGATVDPVLATLLGIIREVLELTDVVIINEDMAFKGDLIAGVDWPDKFEEILQEVDEEFNIELNNIATDDETFTVAQLVQEIKDACEEDEEEEEEHDDDYEDRGGW